MANRQVCVFPLQARTALFCVCSIFAHAGLTANHSLPEFVDFALFWICGHFSSESEFKSCAQSPVVSENMAECAVEFAPPFPLRVEIPPQAKTV